MKTVRDVWVLKSGDWVSIFESREDIMKVLANQEFLDQFPENIVFTIQPGYQIVDFEVPGTEYYDNPDKPLLITKAEVE